VFGRLIYARVVDALLLFHLNFLVTINQNKMSAGKENAMEDIPIATLLTKMQDLV